MGQRKRIKAEQIKEDRKTLYLAKLNNCPTSPRKMRLVADLVRGRDVITASNVLRFSPKEASRKLEKLLWSALHNYEQKTGNKWETGDLYVKEIFVDSARMLKRIQAAPQGRAHRIRKRSNHVTIILDTMGKDVKKETSTDKENIK
jgi:large subunit ribosomal protein L22